jgi:hypothetical protein
MADLGAECALPYSAADLAVYVYRAAARAAVAETLDDRLERDIAAERDAMRRLIERMVSRIAVIVALLVTLPGVAFAQIGQASPHQMTIGQPADPDHVIHQLPIAPNAKQSKGKRPRKTVPSQRPGSGNVLIPGGVLK